MSQYYFLHINTAQAVSYVAISTEENVIIGRVDMDTQKQAAMVNVCIQQLLNAHEISPEKIAAISVNNGPGSYTGLRISLATAKGLAFGWNIPLILHNYLDLLAYQYPQTEDYALLLKAREGEYYMTVFRNGQQIIEPKHVMLQDGIDELHQLGVQTVVTEPDDPFGNQDFKKVPMNDDVISAMAALTSIRFSEKKWDDLAYSEPYYLKPAYVTTPKNNILHKN